QAPQGRGRRAAASHPLQTADALKERRHTLSLPMSAETRPDGDNHSLWRWVGPLAALVVLTAVGLVLHHQFAHLHVKRVFAHLHPIPRRQELAALGFTALSYWLLTTYETLGLAYLRRLIPYPRILLNSFIAYSFAHTLGFAAFTSAAIRLRLYASAGISAI